VSTDFNYDGVRPSNPVLSTVEELRKLPGGSLIRTNDISVNSGHGSENFWFRSVGDCDCFVSAGYENSVELSFQEALDSGRVELLYLPDRA
jgi:hypothetical protein